MGHRAVYIELFSRVLLRQVNQDSSRSYILRIIFPDNGFCDPTCAIILITRFVSASAESSSMLHMLRSARYKVTK